MFCEVAVVKRLVALVAALSIFVSPAFAEERHAIIEQIREQVIRESVGDELPIVVFDVDGTVFDNRYRTTAILRDFVRKDTDFSTEAADTILSLEPGHVRYYMVDTLKDVGVNDLFFIEGASQYWSGNFFTNNYLDRDEPIPGAVEYVNSLHEAGAMIVYLTGRDQPNMLEGTVAHMREVGFPIGIDRTILIMKPVPYSPSYPFKRTAYQTIDKMGRVVAVFDNEPSYANEVKKHWPWAQIVLLRTPHSSPVRDLDEDIVFLERY